MYRNTFLRGSFMSLLIWLAIAFNMPVHGTINYVDTIKDSTNQTLSQLLHIPTYKDLEDVVSNYVVPKNKIFVPPKDDLQCMAENIYYEAATQSYVGKVAVGQVVLNRVKSPNYPSTICGVIYEGSQNIHTSTCQFSWTCAPRNPVNKSSVYWDQSLAVAKELLSKRGSLVDITEGATSYHADYVRPAWSKTLHFVTQIDQHIFYKNYNR